MGWHHKTSSSSTSGWWGITGKGTQKKMVLESFPESRKSGQKAGRVEMDERWPGSLFQIFGIKSSYPCPQISPPATTKFLQAQPNHLHAPKVQTTYICHASPHQTHSEHLETVQIHTAPSVLQRHSTAMIIVIIIWFGDTVTVSHLTKCNTNSKVRATST